MLLSRFLCPFHPTSLNHASLEWCSDLPHHSNCFVWWPVNTVLNRYHRKTKEWSILLFFVIMVIVSQLQLSNRTAFNCKVNWFSNKWPWSPEAYFNFYRPFHTCVNIAEVCTIGAQRPAEHSLIPSACSKPLRTSLTETCGWPAGVSCAPVRVHM